MMLGGQFKWSKESPSGYSWYPGGPARACSWVFYGSPKYTYNKVYKYKYNLLLTQSYKNKLEYIENIRICLIFKLYEYVFIN